MCVRTWALAVRRSSSSLRPFSQPPPPSTVAFLVVVIIIEWAETSQKGVREVEKDEGVKGATRWGRQLECKSWVTFARRPRRHIGSKL
ncbi:MAG: hypothetical protein ACKESB_03770 [Candidatus Hodgkinia cicadicola]